MWLLKKKGGDWGEGSRGRWQWKSNQQTRAVDAGQAQLEKAVASVAEWRSDVDHSRCGCLVLVANLMAVHERANCHANAAARHRGKNREKSAETRWSAAEVGSSSAARSDQPVKYPALGHWRDSDGEDLWHRDAGTRAHPRMLP